MTRVPRLPSTFALVAVLLSVAAVARPAAAARSSRETLTVQGGLSALLRGPQRPPARAEGAPPLASRPAAAASRAGLRGSLFSDPEGDRPRRPLIGILSQPLPDAAAARLRLSSAAAATASAAGGGSGPSFIAASYVKFVESGGARAVPVRYDAPADEIERIFSAVNGLLLPGGSADIVSAGSRFRIAGQQLLDLAKEDNLGAHFFPIHGTCLGFEQLAVLVASEGSRSRSEERSVLSRFRADNAAAAVRWAPAAEESGMFGKVPWLRRLLEDPARNLTYENHQWGVDPAEFAPGTPLGSAFTVLATSLDKDGLEYVAAVEGRGGSAFLSGTQWHPEKNTFEWAPWLDVPRGTAASAATQYLADWLVARARRSGHAPQSAEEEEGLLIYNWEPLHMRRNGSALRGAGGPVKVTTEDEGAVGGAGGGGGMISEGERPASPLLSSGDVETLFDQIYLFPAWEDDKGSSQHEQRVGDGGGSSSGAES